MQKSAWFSEPKGSPSGFEGRVNQSLGLVRYLPPPNSRTRGLSVNTAPNSPALCPGNQPAWSFIALSNRWAAGFLWVLIECLAWRGLPAWLPGRLLPILGNKTSSITGSRSCCHVSHSSALPAGWAFQSPGATWTLSCQWRRRVGVPTTAASYHKSRQKCVGYWAGCAIVCPCPNHLTSPLRFPPLSAGV